MYKITLLFAFCICSFASNAQNAKAIFDAESIVYYGIDFSKTKFALPDAKASEIKDKYFEGWNELVMTDNERFNKESAFQKLKIYYDLAVVGRRNAAVKINEIEGNADNLLSKEAIEQIISDYKGGSKTQGVGFVFVVESFSKKKAEGVAHAVFFDIATRKVLLDKRMVGEARGGGLLNYWTRPFQVMFENMTGGLYDTWRKEAVK